MTRSGSILGAVARTALLLGAALLAGCVTAPVGQRAIPDAAWVQAGPDGRAIVRIVTAGACPVLRVDGAALPTAVRVEPATVAPRAAVGPAAQPARFPVRTCEAALRPGTRSVAWSGGALPAWLARIERVVVLGDTGCRLSTFAMQDCADPRDWPFAAVARAAADERPDLVVHVGDYHYREAPCGAAAGCAGTAWGYGWDAWSADFFEPAAPLLAVAPWVFVRGNHEECARAGQGWMRFLDPWPWSAQRSCDRPADDDLGDFGEPYAVPFGEGTRLVVFDSARAGNARLDVDHPRDARTFDTYVRQLRALDTLAGAGGETLFASHHPALGFAPGGREGWYGGNPALVAALRAVYGDAYFPARIAATLHGHVHLFEAISFATPQPPSIVAGTGGDLLDDAFPEGFGTAASPAPNVRVAELDWARRFAYLVMQRDAGGGWSIVAKAADGSLLRRCALAARTLTCR